MKILLIILYCISLHAAIDEQKYKTECDNGNLKSCNELGNFYANKRGKNPESLLKKACDAGFGESCYHLAYYYRRFGESKIPIFEKYLKKGCNGEFALACYELGQNNHPSPNQKNKDWSLALDYYRRGCDYGNQDSCIAYIDICKKNDIMINYKRSHNRKYNKTHKIKLQTENKTKSKITNNSIRSNCENNKGTLKWSNSLNKWVCQKKLNSGNKKIHTYAGIKMYSSAKNNPLLRNNNFIKKIFGMRGSVITDENNIIIKIIIKGDIHKNEMKKIVKKFYKKYSFIEKTQLTGKQELINRLTKDGKKINENKLYKYVTSHKRFEQILNTTITAYVFKNGDDTILFESRTSESDYSYVTIEYTSQEYTNKKNQKLYELKKETEKRKKKHNEELNSL